MSSYCFLFVNSLLFMMLVKIWKNKGNIGLDFFLCLLFTFLGNMAFPSVNTVIALINAIMGIKLTKI